MFKNRENAAVQLAGSVSMRLRELRSDVSSSLVAGWGLDGGQRAPQGIYADGMEVDGELPVVALSRPLVLGIPRGGVETAYHVARHLGCEWDVVISRKLGYPQNPESAFGAIAEGGAVYLQPNRMPMLTRPVIDSVMEIEQRELERRLRIYRGDRPLPSLKGRFVIVVDDGVATGATMFATLESVRKGSPAAVMVAIPVCSLSMKKTLESLVEEVMVLETPSDYFAVSQVYESFPALSDKDVLSLLKTRSAAEPALHSDGEAGEEGKEGKTGDKRRVTRPITP